MDKNAFDFIDYTPNSILFIKGGKVVGEYVIPHPKKGVKKKQETKNIFVFEGDKQKWTFYTGESPDRGKLLIEGEEYHVVEGWAVYECIKFI